MCPAVLRLRDLPGVSLIPICPEVAGGLGVPRPPAAICHGHGGDVLDRAARVRTAAGQDVTGFYLRGAEYVAEIAAFYRPDAAVLKERSPACGVRSVHACHSSELRPGPGVATARLQRQFPALPIFSEETLTAALSAPWSGSSGEWLEPLRQAAKGV